ncbi:MAG: hypothetical protein SVU88_01435 [Candidatus Nanohaloarchaea archaeon]|nr:hypothetical protein [Candidatus Nanohaloarchaea archaeon]
MVEFKTLETEDIEFGEDEFLEVARKKAVSGGGENEFISLSRGVVTEDGDRRYRENFSVPQDGDVVRFLRDTLPGMLDEQD